MKSPAIGWVFHAFCPHVSTEQFLSGIRKSAGRWLNPHSGFNGSTAQTVFCQRFRLPRYIGIPRGRRSHLRQSNLHLFNGLFTDCLGTAQVNPVKSVPDAGHHLYDVCLRRQRLRRLRGLHPGAGRENKGQRGQLFFGPGAHHHPGPPAVPWWAACFWSGRACRRISPETSWWRRWRARFRSGHRPGRGAGDHQASGHERRRLPGSKLVLHRWRTPRCCQI